MRPFAAFLALALTMPAGAGAAVDERQSIARVFAKAGCRECHNEAGVASDTRLTFADPGTPVADVAARVQSLLELVDRDRPGESRLLKKPTRRMMHEGGQKIAPGSAEEQALVAWIADVARAPKPEAIALVLQSESGAFAQGGRPVFRRLTARQYDNTVRDLLGDTTSPGRQFPPEDFVDGFRNQYQGQSVSPVLAEAYDAAAERLAAAAVRSIRRGDPHRLLPCARGPACREPFIRAFGRRAFRRPLDESEVRRYRTLWARQPSFDEGLRIVIESMLVAPSFLYLVDYTTPQLAPYAKAARLAFFLWNTAPDDALLDAAARGELDSDEGLERAAQRLLADPRAAEAVDTFVAEWMRTDQIRGAYKDRRAFPMFTPDLAAAMAEETRRFVADLVWNDRDFRTLFSARYTFVNAELANLYGVPPPADGFARVDLPANVDRAGVLGHAAFLAGTSKPADTSPTARGLYVREHFLCQKVPTPPPGVNMNLPPLQEDKPQTNRERLSVHLADESCARCHNLVDTIGFGFEKYDALGRRQEVLEVKLPGPRGPDGKRDRQGGKTVTLPLDANGAIAGHPNGAFKSVVELGNILAESARAQGCVARQVFRYAMGRTETPADRAGLERVTARFRSSGFKFKELLVAVARESEHAGTGARP